ncbi:unnamed protein product [Lathyrus sativus]|nr:unnamed protein product [Lathyrus sativus]
MMATLIKDAGASNKYDVFLSFSGHDTYTFTSNLYYALRSKRIKTFFFPKEIQNHDDQDQLQLSPYVSKTIQESKISFVVLSLNYASSTRCLDELVKILECTDPQFVRPIYYNVKVSHVTHQMGPIREAFLMLEKNYPDRIQQWRRALRGITYVCGWHFGNDQFDYELIQKIVDLTVRYMPRYDVFLSFCGEDTRYSFTGFLYQALRREGFKIFMDDEGLEGGNQISQTLLKAIEKSRLSIVVLSENYGYSTWCLDELVKIMECKKAKSQLVWPIFYKTEQSDVSNQTKSYGEAMRAHEDKFGKDSENVQKWRSALSEVALLKGDHIKENEYEYEFIKKIVERAVEAENHM